MSLETGPQLLADFALGLTAGVLLRRTGVRVAACFGIPFLVSFVAFGPTNFGGSRADGGGLLYTFFAYFVFLGFVASGVGGGLGFLIRKALKLKT